MINILQRKWAAACSLLLLCICGYNVPADAQVKPMPLTVQEHDQWCWAGVSQAVLTYYGKWIPQCTIAEYARTSSTMVNFGTTNCCFNTTLGCNQPNYNWGYPGSIQDILVHFGNVSNTGVAATLTPSQITTEISNNHVFIEHWSWATSGGHFVVGHGIAISGSTTTIYYMNPWPGEGLHFCDYSWMLSGVNGMGDHTWDGTNKITSYPAVNGVSQVQEAAGNGLVYPNPSTGDVWVNNEANDELSVYDLSGKRVYYGVLQTANAKVDLHDLSKGMYIVRLFSADGSTMSKLVID